MVPTGYFPWHVYGCRLFFKGAHHRKATQTGFWFYTEETICRCVVLHFVLSCWVEVNWNHIQRLWNRCSTERSWVEVKWKYLGEVQLISNLHTSLNLPTHLDANHWTSGSLWRLTPEAWQWILWVLRLVLVLWLRNNFPFTIFDHLPVASEHNEEGGGFWRSFEQWHKSANAEISTDGTKCSKWP